MKNRVLSGIGYGLLAAIVMELFQSELHRATKTAPESAPQPPAKKPATVVAADRLSQALVGHPLDPRAEWLAGEGMHYATGAVLGAVYSLSQERLPGNRLARGALFGTLVFVFADELMNTALGLTESPLKYPLRSHAYALASHLVFGSTLAALAA